MVIGMITIKPLRCPASVGPRPSRPPLRLLRARRPRSVASARLQPETGEAVAGDFAGQFGLPAQIGAHRVLVAGMPVVVPEDVVDTLGIGRLVGRRGEG